MVGAAVDERGWSWWAVDVESPESAEPDIFHLNEPTREGIIAVAAREWPDCWVAIVEATQDGPFTARPFDEEGDCRLLESVWDKFTDENGARLGEDSDGFPWGLIDAEMARRLNDTFEAVCRENHEALMEGAWAFTSTRNFEIVYTAAAG